MEYRRATIEDAENLFLLKNDPTVRENAIIKDEIDWNEHIAWFTKSLYHKVVIWIILTDSCEFAGDVRIQDGEIGIRLSATYRGLGYGYEAIKKFARKGMTAKIVEGNVGSMRIFVKNGFNFIDYKDGVYTLKK